MMKGESAMFTSRVEKLPRFQRWGNLDVLQSPGSSHRSAIDDPGDLEFEPRVLEELAVVHVDE